MTLTASSAFQTALDAGTIEQIALVTMELQNGTVERYCDQHTNIASNSNTFLRALMPSSIDDITYDSGSNVSFLHVTLTLGANGIDTYELIRKLYDQAKVTISWAHWADPDDVVSQFIGYVSDVDLETERTAVLEIRSILAQAKREAIVQITRECPAILGDSGGFFKCNVDMSSFTDTFTITAVAHPWEWTATFSTDRPDKWYNHGLVTFTSGEVDGAVLEVRRHLDDDIQTWMGVPGFTPIIGDTGTITAGCDKRFPTCVSKFDNGLNFQGYWWIVPKDIAVQQTEDPKVDPRLNPLSTSYRNVLE